VERETTEFDDWPLELGPHLIGVEARKVRAFIARTVGVLLLAFMILKVIKEIHPHSVGGRPSHFSETLHA
jgi:hypothetical protein